MIKNQGIVDPDLSGVKDQEIWISLELTSIEIPIRTSLCYKTMEAGFT